MIDCKPLLQRVVDQHPCPLIFATISGAHLYGFPSDDSDFDIRGVHTVSAETFLGLRSYEETIDQTEILERREFDLVTHDARKFFKLMLKNNGYVLEQLFSPLVLVTTPEHEELIALGQDCITRNHVHHYRGFAWNQWKLWRKEEPQRVKPLLYVYRVLLTGIYLMQSGKLNANLMELNEIFELPYINDLVDQKCTGTEKQLLAQNDVSFHEQEFERLMEVLDNAGRDSALPEAATARNGLNDLLLRIRLQCCREITS